MMHGAKTALFLIKSDAIYPIKWHHFLKCLKIWELFGVLKYLIVKGL